MTTTEQRALLTIALLAALADGDKADSERDAIKRIAESIAGAQGAASLADVHPDVLLGRVDVATAAAGLTEPGHRQLAYELAVCVCDADGAQSPAEQRFLAALKAALSLGDAQTAQVEREAGALVALPLGEPDSAVTAATATVATVAKPQVNDSELDATILNQSILCGALELLPQSWASMAIIPLQMKLVYRIGQTHGYELDKGHIKEFLAAAGVGLTSQFLEQFGRKLLGGLLGAVVGGVGRMAGGAATGMAFSFASTYALGHLAKRYYAEGRQMNTAMLQQTFNSLLEPARQLQSQYLPQIQQAARSIDVSKIVEMVKKF